MKQRAPLLLLLVLAVAFGIFLDQYEAHRPALEAVVIGEHPFLSNPNVTYRSTSFSDRIPEPVILIAADTPLTHSQQKQITSWLQAGKAVLFFGDPVDPETAVVNLGKRVPVVPVEENVNSRTVLYGAFYYEKQKRYIPLFLLATGERDRLFPNVQHFLLSADSSFDF